MTDNLAAWLRSTGQDLTELRLEAAIEKNSLADWLGVTRATLNRWIRTGQAPSWALRLTALKAGYPLHDTWAGWKFGRDGRLYSPELRDGFNPGDVQALPFLWQLVREWERRNSAPAQYLLEI